MFWKLSPQSPFRPYGLLPHPPTNIPSSSCLSELQVSSWNSVKSLEAPEIALRVRQENSSPSFLLPLPSFTPSFLSPPNIGSYESITGNKQETKSLKCLFTSCLTFDGSRNITDTKRIVALGPWETENRPWQSFQGKHQITISSCFKHCKRAQSVKTLYLLFLALHKCGALFLFIEPGETVKGFLLQSETTLYFVSWVGRAIG